jgi:putative spermidine/putrescine transport system ATP-binding protein/spermidine/putrescine transport system ATP-binding protein
MAEPSEESPRPTGGRASGDPPVAFEDVTKIYGDVTAVKDVSLTVGEKEFLTLLGPSGAGKTTLLHMIAGFTTPSSGEIYIDGEPVSAKPPYERNIGMVFQSMALFPHMTVRGNIAFPLKMRRWEPDAIDDRVEEMLDLVRLPGTEKRNVAELSGGQQQRIAIARGLAFEPSLLLLDEPLSSLDKKLREEMRHEISRIHDETDVTTIHVTHNQEEALTMADRIAVIDEGEIEQLANTEDLYNEPRTSFVADFIGNTNMVQGVVVDGGRVRSADGSLEFSASLDGYEPDDGVSVGLRHEQIRIDDADPGTDTTVPATVANTIFRGDVIDYTVRPESIDAQLHIVKLNEKHTKAFEPGEEVVVGWNSENVLVYPS